MKHQFKSLEETFSENLFITSDSYLNHSLICDACRYHRSDVLFQRKMWRGSSLEPLFRSANRSSFKNLILGHSDEYTGISRILFLEVLGYKRIFGVNVAKFKDISSPIPIGLTNNTNESEYHRLFGSNELLLKANQVSFPSFSNGLVYGCFSTSTNKRERVPLAKLLSQTKHTFVEPDFSLEGRVKYLENLRKFAFTVCPVGNGIDTHRLWEVLYMGGIPIIKKNLLLESMLEDLPHVVVSDWNQINDNDFLQASWNVASKVDSYNFEKLNLNYWINFIHMI